MWAMLAMAGFQAVSSISQGIAQKNAADANAAAMREEAAYQRWRSVENQEQYVREAKKQIEAGNVAYAKNGVRLSSGSVQDVFADNMDTINRDTAMIRFEGKFAERRALIGAENYENQGKAAMLNGILGAMGAGLQGASNAGLLSPSTTTTNPVNSWSRPPVPDNNFDIGKVIQSGRSTKGTVNRWSRR